MLRHILWFPLVGLALACTGSIVGDPPSSDTDGDGIPNPQDPTPGGTVTQGDGDPSGSLAPGLALPDGVGGKPLERLSRREYLNTISDLMGVEASDIELPTDGLGPSGFELPGHVSSVEGRALQDAAEVVTAHVVSDLPRLMGCDPIGQEQACFSTFLTSFGRRAYRRPLEAEESSRLTAFYQAARLDHDVPEAVGLVLRAMLQSPQFLYHWQLGSSPPAVVNGVIALTPYELASRLSYLVWGSLPDTELLDAAAAGQLSAPAELAAQVERLLADPRGERGISDFHLQWLSLQGLSTAQKDAGLYPDFGPALAQAMTQATGAFANDVIRSADGSFAALLTSPRVFVNAALAPIYGLTAPVGSGLVAADADPMQRAGILTQVAFLTAQATASGSNPILRGKAVYERVACGVVAAPPPNVPPPTPPAPNLTTRERFAQHAANACAKACHEKFDPPGFAFENYDAIGGYRTTENGRPVDASGVLQLPLDGPVPFQNAIELAHTLAESSDARQCFVRQWTRYALKRHEIEAELGSLQSTFDAFSASSFNVRELLKKLATTKTFLSRTPAAGEVTR